MQTLFETVLNGNLTITTYILCAAVSLICGLATAFTAMYKNHISKGFFVSLVLLPLIVDTVITIVNGNIGTGVAVMGAFSLIRFRSAPGKAKDIVSIFAAMTAGLICAAGYLAIAIVFTVIVCALAVAMNTVTFSSERELVLSITTPESLNYADAFDDVFAVYTKAHRLTSVKTTNMGSLYRLNYKIQLSDTSKMKDFIDELRCRNGNLEIKLSEGTDNAEEL